MTELERGEKAVPIRRIVQGMRTGVRIAFETLSTGTGLTTLVRRSVADRIAIIAYHNVVAASDAGHGDVSLHLPLPQFIRQLECLIRTHEIVDLDSLATRGTQGRPRAVITFDDAYRGAVTLALPELTRRGLPAVVFVAPGLLGAPSTWWDALGEGGLLSEQTRNAALQEMAGQTDRVMAAFRHQATPALPESYGIASEAELHRFCTGGIRVGSHTWGHEFLPALTVPELNETLARTTEWLDRFDGPRSSWLALPYGGGSAEIARIAVASGHAGVLAIKGGLWQTGHPGTLVPRINVPAGMSWRGVEVRTSGVLGR